MNATEIRDTLLDVTEAVPVPHLDQLAFRAEVRRQRRRRTAGRAVGAGLAAAVVLGGAVSLVGDAAPRPGSRVAQQATPARALGVQVIVDQTLRTVTADGVLGEPGLSVRRIVGSTPEGVVVITQDDVLARVSTVGDVEQLVGRPTLSAYLDGDAVVYETADGVIRWRAIGVKPSRDSATRVGTLLGAGLDIAVRKSTDGVIIHEAGGIHPITLGSDGSTETVREVEVGGRVVAVHTDSGVQFFDADGSRRTAMLGGTVGALTPDGAHYAMVILEAAGANAGLHLLDTATGDVTDVPTPGLDGDAVDLRWADDGRLLVVVANDDATRTLWQCRDGGTACAVLTDDPSGTLTLG